MLGIDLKSKRPEETLKWFLAAILYSKPIRESSATKTYRCFERLGVLTAKRIVQTGWDGLVSILDEGGYTRYDFSTADKLLEVFYKLEKLYKGDLTLLHNRSKDYRDLENRLKELGKGVGDTTVSIFLRDMRGVWEKVDPRPSPLVRSAMEKLGIRDLKQYAAEAGIEVVRLETALLRYAKDFLKKDLTLDLIA
jgi:hypothetical protein